MLNIIKKTCWILIYVLLGLFGAASAEIPEGSYIKPTIKPHIVYVSDFILKVQGDNTAEKGLLPVRKKVKETVNRLVPKKKNSPEEEAKKIVDILAQSIVSALNDKKINSAKSSVRLDLSQRDWLLEGQFFEYDEGSRMKKTIIGFGSGSPTMQVNIVISELIDGNIKPFFDSAMDGKKNRMPGAIITKNPYVAGAKFILTKSAPEKNVKKLGSQIANTVYEIMKEQGFIAD